MELLGSVWPGLVLVGLALAVAFYITMRKKGVKPSDMDDVLMDRLEAAVVRLGDSLPQRVKEAGDKMRETLGKELEQAKAAIATQRDILSAEIKHRLALQEQTARAMQERDALAQKAAQIAAERDEALAMVAEVKKELALVRGAPPVFVSPPAPEGILMDVTGHVLPPPHVGESLVAYATRTVKETGLNPGWLGVVEQLITSPDQADWPLALDKLANRSVYLEKGF